MSRRRRAINVIGLSYDMRMGWWDMSDQDNKRVSAEYVVHYLYTEINMTRERIYTMECIIQERKKTGKTTNKHRWILNTRKNDLGLLCDTLRDALSSLDNINRDL